MMQQRKPKAGPHSLLLLLAAALCLCAGPLLLVWARAPKAPLSRVPRSPRLGGQAAPSATPAPVSALSPNCEFAPLCWRATQGDQSIELALVPPDPADPSRPAGAALVGAACRLFFRLTYQTRALLPWSPLGLRYGENSVGEFVTGLHVLSARLQPGPASPYPLAHGKARLGGEHVYQLLTLELSNAHAARLLLEARVRHDGAALRYLLPQQAELPAASVLVSDETAFRVSNTQGRAWLHEYQSAGWVSPAYEARWKHVAVGAKAPLGWACPLLFQTDPNSFLLFTEAGLDEPFAASHVQVETGRQTDSGQEEESSLYKLVWPPANENEWIGDSRPTVQLPWASPWRLFLAGSLDLLVESTAVTDLSAPLDASFKGRMPDWVRPGKATWDWWSNEQTGGPEQQKLYAAAAAEFSWDYVLVDANWNRWPNAENEVLGLVEAAARVGVGVILWYNSGGPHTRVGEEPRDRMHRKEERRAELAKLQRWGVKGIKVDFWHSDKQERMQQYLDVLADTADYQIMVYFHGCTIPRGWRRRWPHLMTYEAVYGAENYRGESGPGADEHVLYAYARNVIGPMDYTVLTPAKALSRQSLAYAHSLALCVLFESGLTHLADSLTEYHAWFEHMPALKTFLAQLPVVWDETRWVSGHPDCSVVLARRHHTTWYVAGIAGSRAGLSLISTARQALAFIAQLRDAGLGWDVSAFLQGTSPAALQHIALSLPPGAAFTLPPTAANTTIETQLLQSRGGFTLVLRPSSSSDLASS
eukprot:g47750.t1